MPALFCHHCSAAIDVHEPVARDAECPACRGDVRCCRNCRHYDERYNNACTETQADPVPDKARRNFCEFFYFSRDPVAAAGGGAKRESDARAKLDALFGGARPKPASSSDARARLDALFKKPSSDDPER
ncbi:MAG: hypothetical protein ABIS67_00680 [Candidatus Eisenbacteria bacterium]